MRLGLQSKLTPFCVVKGCQYPVWWFTAVFSEQFTAQCAGPLVETAGFILLCSLNKNPRLFTVFYFSIRLLIFKAPILKDVPQNIKSSHYFCWDQRRDRNAAEGHVTSILPFPESFTVSFKVNTAFGVCFILVLYVRSILALCFKIHAAQSQLLFETHNKPLMWFSSRPAFWHSTCLFMFISRRRRRNNGKSSVAWKTSRQQDHALFFNQVLCENQLRFLLFLKLSEPNFNTPLEH